MKDKGFTLIELLAVIIILGVIMMIAIPNVLSMIDKNKKNTFVENAKTMINQAEYTLRRDTNIDYPSEGKAIILSLEYLNTDDVSTSPYSTDYSPSMSFVAIVNNTKNEVTEYKYFVHLVACADINCDNSSESAVNETTGINLTSLDSLSSKERFRLVKQGSQVNFNLGKISNNKMENESELLSIIGATGIEKIFSKTS